MVADRGLQVAAASKMLVVQVDDVEFHRDETKLVVVGNRYSDRDAGEFNDLSLHFDVSARSGLVSEWWKSLDRTRDAFGTWRNDNMTSSKIRHGFRSCLSRLWKCWPCR